MPASRDSRLWWYKAGDEINGPTSDLERLIRLGTVTQDSELRYGESDWRNARSFATAESILQRLGLVQGPASAPGTKSLSEAPKQRKLLYEWAPLIEPDVGRVPLVNVLRGAPQIMRAVGEIETCWVHCDARGSTPCLGEQCARCPGRRDRYGYLDTLMQRPNLHTGQQEAFRAVQSLPPGALRQIADGELMQGCLLALHWKGQGSPTEVKLLQSSCPYPLPNPIDIRAFLCRIWRLPDWPDQEPAKKPADPNILRFRKQA